MSVLTTVEAVPNRLRLFFDFLSGKLKGEDPDRMQALLSPGALQTKELAPESSDQSPSGVYQNPLREAIRLQIAKVVDGKFVGPEFSDGKQSFADWIEQRLLRKHEAEQHGQRWVPYAFAWLLMQSPLRPLPFGDNYSPRIEKDFGPEYECFDLTSKERFQNLGYWACHLGYGTFLADRALIPDPTPALMSKLSIVFNGNSDLRIGDFMSALAEQVSVFEGGAVREELEAVLAKQRGAREEQRLSQATSLALLRLESRGVIALRELSDAAVRILDLGASGTRRVSHITYAKNEVPR